MKSVTFGRRARRAVAAPAQAAALVTSMALLGACAAAGAADPTTGAAGLTDAAAPTSAATVTDANPTGETITLYNSQHKQTTDALVKAFTRQTGINVKVNSSDEAALTAQLAQEGAKSPADVFYTENSNWLEQLSDQHLLAPVDPTALANVPRADSGANGDWVGVSERVSAIVYNSTKITPAELPQSILDLADPRFKGKFELAPSETDFWPLVVSVAKTKGTPAALAWLKAVKDNAGDNGSVPDAETLASDVSQGTTEFAVINHYYYYRLQAEVTNSTSNAKLAYFAPQDPGFLASVSGAGVLRSSRHQAAAQQLVTFLTSRAGQGLLESGASFEYPLGAGVAANPTLPPLATYQPNAFSPADLGDGTTAKTLLQEAGLL